jgi:hypothetical protein
LGAGVEVTPTADSTDVRLDLPVARRVLLRLPAADEAYREFVERSPRVLLVSAASEASDEPGVVRGMGHWVLPQDGPVREVWLARSEAAVELAGESMLDDLPGLPVRIDVTSSSEVDVPLAMGRASWLHLRLDGDRTDGIEVVVHGLPGEHEASGRLRGDGRVFRPAQGRISIPLAPGRYRVRARRGDVDVAEAQVVVVPGRVSVTMPVP